MYVYIYERQIFHVALESITKNVTSNRAFRKKKS